MERDSGIPCERRFAGSRPLRKAKGRGTLSFAMVSRRVEGNFDGGPGCGWAVGRLKRWCLRGMTGFRCGHPLRAALRWLASPSQSEREGHSQFCNGLTAGRGEFRWRSGLWMGGRSVEALVFAGNDGVSMRASSASGAALARVPFAKRKGGAFSVLQWSHGGERGISMAVRVVDGRSVG